MSLVRGTALIPTYLRDKNVWGLKKGFQVLWNRIPGEHVNWIQLSPPQTGASGEGAAKWQPSPDEVRAGMRFMRLELPEAVTLQIVLHPLREAFTHIDLLGHFGYSTPTQRVDANTKRYIVRPHTHLKHT